MIRSKQVRPGERMPTEVELVERFGVSRTTARRALDELRRDGLVTRTPGRGTFVLPPQLGRPLTHLHSIRNDIRQLGYEPHVSVLGTRRGVADGAAAERLRISAGDPVFEVRRLWTADGHPAFTSVSTFSIPAMPEVENADFEAKTLWTILSEESGRRIDKAEQWLSARAAKPEVAQLLEIDVGTPVLERERVIYVEGPLPVEMGTGYFHGDSYSHYCEADAGYASTR